MENMTGLPDKFRRSAYRLAFQGMAILFLVSILVGSYAFSLKPGLKRQIGPTQEQLKSRAGNYLYSQTHLGYVKSYIFMDEQGRCGLFNASSEVILDAMEKKAAIRYTKTKCTYKIAQSELFFYDENEKRNVYCTFKENSAEPDLVIATLVRRIACKGWRFDFTLNPDFDPKVIIAK